MEGQFFEYYDSANAYRAEQLGLCVVHHLIAALSVVYGIPDWRTRLYCDNLVQLKYQGGV